MEVETDLTEDAPAVRRRIGGMEDRVKAFLKEPGVRRRIGGMKDNGQPIQSPEFVRRRIGGIKWKV